MKIGVKNKKQVIIISAIIFFCVIVSLLIYKKARADQYANQIAIKTAAITKIDTGEGDFNSSEGDGLDTSKDNRVVRSFDKLTYFFNFSIKGKSAAQDYDSRTVNIKVTLDDSIKDYVAFGPDSKAGEAAHTFSFNNIDSYNDFQKTIDLYVLSAPNNTEITPKFEISESTNTDPNSVITLGKVDNSIRYEYDSDSTNQYTNQAGFDNYMPTIATSVYEQFDMDVLPQSNEGQTGNYNDETGRYLTFVFGLYVRGDSESGIKGKIAPKGDDINVPFTIAQNGTSDTVRIDNSWARLYSPNSLSSIEPVKVDLPYSKDANSNSLVKAAGNVTLSGQQKNYTLTIKDYATTYNRATLSAIGSQIGKEKHYYGTYALTVFSPRKTEDAKNDITVTILSTAYNINKVDPSDEEPGSVPMKAVAIVNRYYENSDYTLEGEFYDRTGSKISSDKGKGSVSRGTSLNYKTTFNYKKTLSDKGLKEVIKVDPNAFRVVPYNDKKQVNITLVSDNGKINENDFEVKFVTGSFDNTNYSVTSNSESSIDNRISSNDKGTIISACSSKNLSLLNQNQIQNLYGGPCIKANENVEKTYDKIQDAKTTGETEIENPVTKIIIQTKKGVKLPDSVKVMVDVSLYVKNVTDLSQTYQATVLASTSDYDNELAYYTPSVDSSESVMNENNYSKTIYAGNTISSIDDNSPWGDSLKIVNFTSRQKISLKNKNQDGTVKTIYNVQDNETLNYVIKTNINDDNIKVGADDVWYINKLKVTVTLPKELTFIENKSPSNYQLEVENNINGDTILTYMLPFTKPNQAIKDILFDANIKPNLSGTGVEIPVVSKVDAININGEEDLSYFGHLTDRFSIYANGIQNVVLSQKIGPEGSVHEKNTEFSYILTGYNNTGNNITDYSIIDVLPYNGDSNGSKINGKYKVKVTLPSSLSNATVLCSTQEPTKLTNEVKNKNNIFKECDILNDYVDATAIYIDNVSINQASYLDEIKVSIKPTDNNYSNKYINMFKGGNSVYNEMKSNKIESRVISRTISGKVFMDMDEDGIHEEKDRMMANLPATLYKVDDEGNLKKVLQTTTDKDGKYIFKDLDSGVYKVRISYDSALFDLTNRYQSEDYTTDSDAYKIKEGLAEIGYIRNLNDKDDKKDSLETLKVTTNIETVDNLDVGLINRKNFGFDMSKYITKIDLNYNNSINTLNYDNQSKVSISVKNSLKATAKVYYGITLTNNSATAGYAKLVQEDIPNGLIFDPSDPYNSDWIMTDGSVQSTKYASDLINPGESRYLKIVLYMPRQLEATTYINTVSMLEIEPYRPIQLAPDKLADSKSYQIGEEVRYGGVDWHVVKANIGNDEGEQILTLLADNNAISHNMSHTNNTSDAYKWSTSKINKYLNNDWIKNTPIDPSVLIDNYICDDASGAPTSSHGGSLKSDGLCNSNVYTVSKVRLLNMTELQNIRGSALLDGASDISYLSGNYWTMNSVWVEQNHNSYGVVTNNYKNKVWAVADTGTVMKDATTLYQVRPVITISSRNLIAE